MQTYVNAGARLDRLPNSRFHWRLLMMIGGGVFLDSFDIFLAGSVLGALVKTGWSTLAQNADFISVTFVGMLLGSWFAGILGDRFGRRVTYQANLLIFGLASLAGAMATSMTWLIASRLVMGVGLGAEIVVSYSMLNEFVPRRHRGRWGAILVTLSVSAMVVSSLLGYFLVPRYGWRWMFGIVGVGALVITYLRKSLPESPRWLESKGRFEEADAIVSRIEDEVRTQYPLPSVESASYQVQQERSIFTLFSRFLVVRTLVGAICVICVNIVLWGFVSWVPSFLVQRGASVATSIGYTVLMALGAPVGSVLPAFVADTVGRKHLIVLFSVIGMIFAGAYPYAHTASMISLSGFGVVLAASALSSIIFGMYIPELFPTDLRMRGAGFCITAGRLGTAISPYVILSLYKEFGMQGVGWLMLFLLFLMAIVVAFFGIETKSKSLEELADNVNEENLNMNSSKNKTETSQAL